MKKIIKTYVGDTKKDGDVEFVEDDDNLADDDIVFGGSKSDIRRIEDLERNISVLATKLMTTDGAATDDDDDDFGTVVNKKTRFKDDVRFSGAVDFDDNILVLNKDVGGNPSENAGIEIRRGNQTNAKLLWNETNDYWEIASGGTTGRLLTTGDEGTGNGLDADTVDGVEASAFLLKSGGTMTGNLDMGVKNIITTGKVLFANMYATEGDLPSATTYHGMFAHVHATGAGYFAHGGSWIKLANNSDIPTVPTNVSDFTNDAGYVTSTYANSNVDSHINVSGASGGQVLSWTGSDYEWVTRGTSNSDTTYTAGSGLSLSGTTFSVTGDQRGNISQIGQNTSDYITCGLTEIDFYLDNKLDMRLENDGDLHVDGNLVAYSTTTTSDPRLKENITPVENALEKLEKLTGYTFDYKKDGKASAGVLSTEVEQVLPSAVQKTKLPLQADDDKEYDVVEYDQLTAILIEAVKELPLELRSWKMTPLKWTNYYESDSCGSRRNFVCSRTQATINDTDIRSLISASSQQSNLSSVNFTEHLRLTLPAITYSKPYLEA